MVRNTVVPDRSQSSTCPPAPVVAEPLTPGQTILKAVLRPELTAIIGSAVAFAFFGIAAGAQGFLTLSAADNYVEVAAEIGIIAAPATLLLIAGEFDLSVGSMIALAQISIAYTVVSLHWPLWAALAVTLLIACAIGMANGMIIVRTRLPSFIVTLAALYWISGLANGVALDLTGGTIITGVSESLHGSVLERLFKGDIAHMPVATVWWVVFTAVAAWVLYRTPIGNWISATGGNESAAKELGVPVDRIKIGLYMCTAAAAVVVATLQMFVIDQGDASAGADMEFQVVLAAVIGGSLLTGGFGSPIGTAFGALLYGIVVQGFFFTNIPDQWYSLFLGVMLIVAVFINRGFHRVVLRTGGRW